MRKKAMVINEKALPLPSVNALKKTGYRSWGPYHKPFKFKIIVNDMAEVLRK